MYRTILSIQYYSSIGTLAHQCATTLRQTLFTSSESDLKIGARRLFRSLINIGKYVKRIVIDLFVYFKNLEAQS
jgi:hypothetical protein